jgi:dTDP-4-dehydrorhamnose 3,5-epimerase
VRILVGWVGMRVKNTSMAGLKFVEPSRYSDDRGWMSELWNSSGLSGLGFDVSFAQDSMAYNRNMGTIRGLHFQVPPFDQGKLIICVSGSIFDIALDMRVGSSTFGQHLSVTLSSKNSCQLWVPSGFAHGYCSLEPDTKVLYKLTKPYEQGAVGGVFWNDPALNIKWPTQAEVAFVNERDQQWPSFASFESPFRWES